jgi:hypothetical protein
MVRTPPGAVALSTRRYPGFTNRSRSVPRRGCNGPAAAELRTRFVHRSSECKHVSESPIHSSVYYAWSTARPMLTVSPPNGSRTDPPDQGASRDHSVRPHVRAHRHHQGAPELRGPRRHCSRVRPARRPHRRGHHRFSHRSWRQAQRAICQRHCLTLGRLVRWRPWTRTSGSRPSPYVHVVTH